MCEVSDLRTEGNEKFFYKSRMQNFNAWQMPNWAQSRKQKDIDEWGL